MKFTSEMLMKAMGIKIGDTIKLNGKTHTFTIKKDGTLICKNVLKQLIDQDFEILSRPKRVGDTNGDDYENCINCPLRLFDYCGNYCDGNLSLYEVLEQSTKYVKRKGLFDQEIYNIFKNRLDKEVVEEC